jgi:AP-3 complex subunit beta
MDPDHRLLLRSALPLLHSQNSSVILAVTQLYHHTAPALEVAAVARPLVHLLQSQPAVQLTVLTTIATLARERKGMFEAYLKSFFVWNDDPLYIRSIKLEILTTIATETNVGVILREFRECVCSRRGFFYIFDCF